MKNVFPLIVMKDSLKNVWDYERKWFPLARKLVLPARISYFFKNWFLLTAVTVSTSRKKLSSKVTVFIREKYPSPIAGMKDLLKNKFSLDQKKLAPAISFGKMYKSWFVLARKSVSATRSEAFVEKYVFLIAKNCFFWQENQRIWFSIAGKCFAFKIGSP